MRETFYECIMCYFATKDAGLWLAHANGKGHVGRIMSYDNRYPDHPDNRDKRMENLYITEEDIK